MQNQDALALKLIDVRADALQEGWAGLEPRRTLRCAIMVGAQGNYVTDEMSTVCEHQREQLKYRVGWWPRLPRGAPGPISGVACPGSPPLQ